MQGLGTHTRLQTGHEARQQLWLLRINKNQAWQVAKDQTVFKFKDLELQVYFLHMDCNLAQYKESSRGRQRRTLTVKIRAGLQEN
jgi:hypothetical protein